MALIYGFTAYIPYSIAGLIVFAAVLFFVNHRRTRKQFERSLQFILYEVTFSEEESPIGEGGFKNFISIMEQFYSGMSAISETKTAWGTEKNFYVLELALPDVGEEITFYVGVQKQHSRIFEKQLESLFPHARLEVSEHDYNIFNAEGASKGAIITTARNFALPIRTYDKLEADPLEVIANAFSKLKKKGEGAALQIIVETAESRATEKIKRAREMLLGGNSLSASATKGWMDEFSKTMHTFSGPSPAAKQKKEEQKHRVNEEVIKLVNEKLNSPIFKVNIRLIASAPTEEEAEGIIQELSSAFLQFSEPQGNQFVARDIKKSHAQDFFYRFSFRIFSGAHGVYLNARELTTIFHFPYGVVSAPKLKTLKSKDAPAPANVPTEGIRLGVNTFRGESRDVRMKLDDRRRHAYIIGQTGTGKSEFMKHMIRQDIEAGQGLCVIDPHGDMVSDILGQIPEKRVGDVIYFDPGDTAMPMGLNFLEYDERYPEQKTFVVDELLAIFNKLYNMELAGGPMFEQYFRNATHLVLEDPASGNTLLEIIRVLSDKAFREYKLSRSKNPLVNVFWKDIAEKTGGEHALQNMIPYITSKFDTFLSNDIVRPIIAQQQSAFQMRDVMDNGKILLVNLSKGRVGETNSALLGLVIVGKILMAAFSRASEASQEKRRDFFLYLDEFQSITTPSIATILSEARKYKLNLIMAHQFIGQLSDEIRKSVFGNVGTIVSFRIGREDAEIVEKQFEPIFSAHDLTNIENFQAYIKMLIDGQAVKPFNLRTLPPKESNEVAAEAIKELSSQKYGRPKKEIEEEITRRYQ
ncbi:MAG: type IV secretion system DNA-binding domain-containing protein [bacterium]|nr:type IV secretion system DNA-binding domain-containing protein [bacterium]